MKRGVLIFMAWICAFGIQAQSEFSFILNKEGKIIAIPKNKTYELNIPKFSYKTFTPSGTRDIDIKLRKFMPDIPQTGLAERPMDMQISSAAYQPFFNVYTPMIREVSPMALDFNETYMKRLNESFDLIANGVQYTWPGAGGMTILNTGLSWHNDNWRIYGGGFGGRFFTPFNPSPGITAGFNAQVEYQATDWLLLRGWGQYAYYADEYRNPHMLENPFFYHSQVGAAFEVKINENIGVGAGINYEYNPARRRMEPQFLIFPVIRSGRFRIGM